MFEFPHSLSRMARAHTARSLSSFIGRLAICTAASLGSASIASAATIEAFAGGGSVYGDDGPATEALFNIPAGVAVDATGNVFIADSNHFTVRRVDSTTGIITTVAGDQTLGCTGDGGPATEAQMSTPIGIALDTAGSLYLADNSCHRIRKVDFSTGLITTVAGNGVPLFAGDGGLATSASIKSPQGCAFDPSDNLYIADTSNFRIRFVNAVTGIISTIAGTGIPGTTGDGGLATLARLNNPRRIAADAAGNVYIMDRSSSSRVRYIDAATGIITTIAGGGGSTGEDGLAVDAFLGAFGTDVALAPNGKLLIANDLRVWEVDIATNEIHVFAGTGEFGDTGDGGDPLLATFTLLGGVGVSSDGDVYISDAGANRVRVVAAPSPPPPPPPPSPTIEAFAGGGSVDGDGGPATEATLAIPQGVATDAAGNVFIADSNHFTIRRVDGATGIITTIAGDGTLGYSGDGGPATGAQMSTPLGIAVDSVGNVYIADYANHRIRKVNLSTGIITTVAGNGIATFAGDGGPATSASIKAPQGVALDAGDNLYIADTSNFRIRKVDGASGIITTIAGTGFPGTTGDGGLATLAKLLNARRLVVDGEGDVYIMDRSSSSRVRVIDSATGIIDAIAGGGGSTGEDGLAVDAFLGPFGTDVALAPNGKLLIATDLRVFEVDIATNEIHVFAGTGEIGDTGDGGDPLLATFATLGGVGVSDDGDVYISDTFGGFPQVFANRVRVVAGVEIGDVIITPDTTQEFLDSLVTITGNLILVGVPGVTSLSLPNLLSVGGDFLVTGNADLVTLSAPSLTSIGGSIDLSDNLLLDGVVLPALGDVAGDVTVSGNPSAGSIDFGGTSTVGGDVTVGGNPSAGTIDFGDLSSAGGDVTISGNPSAGTIDFSSMSSAGGDVTISGNPSAGTIDFSGMSSAGGDVTVGGNASAGTIDFGQMSTADGDVTISGNPSAGTINFGASMRRGETSLAVTGSLSITDNPLASVHLPTTFSVGGDFTLETIGDSVIDLSGAAVVGNIDVNVGDTATLLGVTGGETTTVALENPEVGAGILLPAGAFTEPVDFTLQLLDAGELLPKEGVDSVGTAVLVDSVAGYKFTFATTTLEQPGELKLEVDVAALDPETQAAFLAAITSGSVTLSVQSDEPDSQPLALAVCLEGELPTPDGCVAVTLLDVDHLPLPPDSPDAPAFVQVYAIVTHFSTYAVAMVTLEAPAGCEGDSNGDGEVDPLDAGYVLARFGCLVGVGNADCDAADQNLDGEVDPLDYGYVLARFGDCP